MKIKVRKIALGELEVALGDNSEELVLLQHLNFGWLFFLAFLFFFLLYLFLFELLGLIKDVAFSELFYIVY